jgi:hypothetical protein
MRSTAIAAAVWAMTLAGGSSQQILAQNTVPPTAPPSNGATSPPATEGRSGIPQAPVGHRQPTQRDLPPEVLRREQSGEQQPRVNDSYQPPSICRGC